MNASLSKVSETVTALRLAADKLKVDLDKARTDLQELKANCSGYPSNISSMCTPISTDNLKQEANFSTVPDVNSELGNLNSILSQNFSGAVAQGIAVFDKIPDTTADMADPKLKDIRKLAEDGKDNLLSSTKSIFKKIDDFLNKKPEYQKYKKDSIDKYVDIDNLRYYGYAGLASMVTVIVVLLSVGLTCGICGYSRNHNPVQRSSSSHHGGNCVMASIGFMFIFASCLFSLTGLFFFLGEHLHIMCRELKNGEIIDKYVGDKIKISGTAIKFTTMLRNCRNNMPTYNAIDGKKIFDLEDKLNITKMLNIDGQLDLIKIDLSGQTILNNKTKKSLQDLKSSSVDKINFTKFIEEIGKKIVLVDLTVLANNLTNIASSIRAASSSAESLALSFERIANDLMKIQNGSVKSMGSLSAVLKTNVDDMKARAKDLSSVAVNILNKLEVADAYVKHNVTGNIKSLIKTFADRVLGWPKEFVAHVMKEVKENLARCKPIANVYDGVINVYFCNGIVGNFNGFWLAMGWCLFFFPFAIIFGVKAAKYYRRMNMLSGFDPDPYPGYEPQQQHAVKIPMQEFEGMAPPPYSA